MVRIRLSRFGSKNRPFYHIVATHRHDRRDGGHPERLGFYNPVAKGQEETLLIELDRVDYWLSVGAQMSDTVAGLVKRYRQMQAAAA